MMTRRLAIFLALAAVTALFISPHSMPAKTTPPEAGQNMTTVDGVYTAAQAAGGKTAFATYCGNCHFVSDVSERNGAPPLTGSAFINKFGGYDLGMLYDVISRSMPPASSMLDRTASLSENTYLDIIGYILQGNGYPSGSTQLTANIIRSIRFVGAEGGVQLPDGALIRVVGCLARDSNGDWLLVHASEPVRSRTPFETSRQELEAAHAQPLGTGTYGLLAIDYVRDAGGQQGEGSKVQAKGLLVRQSDGERVSLTSLDTVASSCPR